MELNTGPGARTEVRMRERLQMQRTRNVLGGFLGLVLLGVLMWNLIGTGLGRGGVALVLQQGATIPAAQDPTDEGAPAGGDPTTGDTAAADSTSGDPTTRPNGPTMTAPLPTGSGHGPRVNHGAALPTIPVTTSKAVTAAAQTSQPGSTTQAPGSGPVSTATTTTAPWEPPPTTTWTPPWTSTSTATSTHTHPSTSTSTSTSTTTSSPPTSTSTPPTSTSTTTTPPTDTGTTTTTTPPTDTTTTAPTTATTTSSSTTAPVGP